MDLTYFDLLPEELIKEIYLSVRYADDLTSLRDVSDWTQKIFGKVNILNIISNLSQFYKISPFILKNLGLDIRFLISDIGLLILKDKKFTIAESKDVDISELSYLISYLEEDYSFEYVSLYDIRKDFSEQTDLASFMSFGLLDLFDSEFINFVKSADLIPRTYIRHSFDETKLKQDILEILETGLVSKDIVILILTIYSTYNELANHLLDIWIERLGFGRLSLNTPLLITGLIFNYDVNNFQNFNFPTYFPSYPQKFTLLRKDLLNIINFSKK